MGGFLLTSPDYERGFRSMPNGSTT